MSRTYLARVNGDGTLDTGFDPKPDNWVYCAALHADGKIVIGGYFSAVAATTRNHLV